MGRNTGLLGHGQFHRQLFSGREYHHGLATFQEDVLVHGEGNHSVFLPFGNVGRNPGDFLRDGQGPGQVGSNGYGIRSAAVSSFHLFHIDGEERLLTHLGQFHFHGNQVAGSKDEFGLTGLQALIGRHGEFHHIIAFASLLFG